MVSVIVCMTPFVLPKLFGIQVYAILTGSMTPSYPIGGVVYVKEAEAADISAGDVITYCMGTNTKYVMTHRVAETNGSYFITKGDANNTTDPEPVSSERLIGKVIFYLPKLAEVFAFVNSRMGYLLLGILFAFSLLCWMLAYRISPPKQKKKREFSWMRFIGILCIIGSLFYLGSVCFSYQKSATEYETIRKKVFSKIEPSEYQFEENETLTVEEKEILDRINTLHTQYPDLIGWIVFDNLDISYPIMQGTDDSYYLKHMFSGEKNAGGSIFMEANNSSDFNDAHTIIYGHNMKDGSMFGSLNAYKTKENFYVGNEYFTIYTGDTVYRYEIFSYYDISENGEIYTIEVQAGKNFQEFLDKMCRRSYYDTQIKPTEEDKVITLSTCSSKGNRFVIHARRIGEKK